jgi:hypothetical protein
VTEDSETDDALAGNRKGNIRPVLLRHSFQRLSFGVNGSILRMGAELSVKCVVPDRFRPAQRQDAYRRLVVMLQGNFMWVWFGHSGLLNAGVLEKNKSGYLESLSSTLGPMRLRGSL